MKVEDIAALRALLAEDWGVEKSSHNPDDYSRVGPIESWADNSIGDDGVRAPKGVIEALSHAMEKIVPALLAEHDRLRALCEDNGIDPDPPRPPGPRCVIDPEKMRADHDRDGRPETVATCTRCGETLHMNMGLVQAREMRLHENQHLLPECRGGGE